MPALTVSPNRTPVPSTVFLGPGTVLDRARRRELMAGNVTVVLRGDLSGPDGFGFTAQWCVWNASAICIQTWPADLPYDPEAVAGDLANACDLTRRPLLIMAAPAFALGWLAHAQHWRRKGTPLLGHDLAAGAREFWVEGFGSKELK
jgi:hypothetical protein